jgi:protein gp37
VSDNSAIQWTDATWNPTTGCTKVSPGCAHCYIERTPAFRINGRKFVNGATDLRLHADRLEQPLHWRKPRRVFVNSLSDLFHDDVPDAFIDQVFAVMALCPQHTFQVLTKRPERMRSRTSGSRCCSRRRPRCGSSARSRSSGRSTSRRG